MYEINENTLNKKISIFDLKLFNKISGKVYESREENFVFLDKNIDHLIFVVEDGVIKKIRTVLNERKDKSLINKMIDRYGEYKYDTATDLKEKVNETTELLTWKLKKFKLAKNKNKEIKNKDKKLIIWDINNFIIIYKEVDDITSIVYQLK